MDREDACRLVIFEYLLPGQKLQRARVIQGCFENEFDRLFRPSRHLSGLFEEIHWLSERLLASQGFSTSYIYPMTMRHENEELNRRLNVRALIDSDGPFVWNLTCQRKADPPSGIRVFRGNGGLSAGRLP